MASLRVCFKTYEPLVEPCKHTATRGFLLISSILGGLNSFFHGCILGFLLIFEHSIVVDYDFRSAITFILINYSYRPFSINLGDKIAQLIFEKNETPIFVKRNNLSANERGCKGFGSYDV